MAQLYSMTGFGKSVLQLPGKKITIEIKGLNSKQIDINLRLSSEFKAHEGDFRQLISEKLLRGKIDCTIYCEVTGIESAPKINEQLALGYIDQLKSLASKSNLEGDILASVMRIPELMESAEQELDEEAVGQVLNLLDEAITKMIDFRSKEGAALKSDLVLRLANISKALKSLEQYEGERIERLRERIYKSLEKLKVEVNEDRFEQEMIYYLEKFDVTEEKVRLAAHLKYFEELMSQANGAIGRKLGFVCQEIGREVNTLGSKANHSELQKIVVEMKDDLEKIKEQILNIL